MNATEQTKHKRVTDELDARLSTVEEILAALDGRVSGVAQAAHRSISEERAHRLTLAEEQRAYVDGEDRQLRQGIRTLTEAEQETRVMVRAHRDRGFWGRWRWLLRGR